MDADLLKKLGFAPKDESYIINVIRYLGLIDEEGRRTEEGHKTFTLHEEQAFQTAFAEIVKKAYNGLFEIYKEDSWTQPDNKLISFFRQADQSSEIVGGRQASTFKTLAVYAGRSTESVGNPKTATNKKQSRSTSKVGKALTKHTNGTVSQDDAARTLPHGNGRFSLTVRIEVNLPAGGD